MEGVDSLLRGYVPGPLGGWASSLLRVALTATRSGTEEADGRFGSSKPGGVDGAAAMMVSRQREEEEEELAHERAPPASAQDKEDEEEGSSSSGGGGGRGLSPLEAVLPWPDLSWLLQSFLPATDIQSCRLCSRAMRSAVMHRHALWLRWPDSSSSSHHQRQQRATEGGGLLRRWLWPSSYRPSQEKGEEEEEEDEDEGGCGGGLWGLQALLGPGHAEGSRITTLVLPREGGQWWVGALAAGLSQGALPALTAIVMTGPVPASSPHTAALLQELGRPRRWGLSRLSLALSAGEEEGEGGGVCAALEALSGALEGHVGTLELLALDLTHALRGVGQQEGQQLGPALVRVLAGKPCLAGLRYLGLVAHPSPCAWETSSSSSSQGRGGWSEAVHQALAAYLWEARRPHLRSLVTGLHALPPTSPPASSLQPLLSLAQAWGDEEEGGGGRCPGLELCQGPLQCMLSLPPRLAGCPAALAIQHALARAVAGPAAWGRQLRSLVLLVLPGSRLLSSFLQSVAQCSHRCPQVRHVRLELKANRQQQQQQEELLQPLRLVLSLPAFPGLRELEVVDEAGALDEHSLREHVQRWWATAPGGSSSSSRGGAVLVYHGSGGGREEGAGRARTHRWTAAAASD